MFDSEIDMNQVKEQLSIDQSCDEKTTKLESKSYIHSHT
jgi:hypothetical protein